MFNRNTIRQQVLAKVEEKITAAQDSYNKVCQSIDEQASVAKANAFDEAVNSIIGKLI